MPATYEDLRIAVVGYGNIGRRHVNSLLELGVTQVTLVRRDVGRPVDGAHSGLERVSSLSQAAERSLDGVVVCTPTACHKEAVEFCIGRGIPVLTEKPIVASWDQALQLVPKYQASPVPILIGYDLRFTEPVRVIEECLTTGRLGPVRLAQLEAGGYLPDWRPQLDYRQLYSARATLGGGVALDLIHEVDCMRLFFGSPTSVMAAVEKKSDLEIDTDDVAAMIFEYDSGPIVTVVMDYLRRPVGRQYRIVGETATLIWDEHAGEVALHEAGSSAPAIAWAASRSKQTRSAFVSEMSHFLDVVRRATSPIADFWDGINTVGLIEAAKKSSLEGSRQSTEEFTVTRRV